MQDLRHGLVVDPNPVWAAIVHRQHVLPSLNKNRQAYFLTTLRKTCSRMPRDLRRNHRLLAATIVTWPYCRGQTKYPLEGKHHATWAGHKVSFALRDGYGKAHTR